MKTTISKVSFVFLFLLACVSANAQLKLMRTNQNYLVVDAPTPFLDYKVTIEGRGIYIKQGSQFLQFDLCPANPRIAGTGNQVVFYNSQASRFNSIQVANVYTYSDALAKTNIQKINNGSSIISRLRPVSYDFIDKQMLTLRGSSTAPEYGFLAQEVEAILPGAVVTDEEGHKLVNYTTLIPLLVEAVQTLQAEVETLKKSR